jgi:hypothetical protein
VNMTRNPNQVNVVTAADIENMRRTNGPQAVDAKDIISGKIDGRPTFHCAHVESDPRWLGSQVTCTFTAPQGSDEVARHLANAHVRKLTAEERRRAEDFEARRTAIYPKPWPCEKCGDTMRPSEVHWCRGTPTPVGQMPPHEAQAQAFAREGLKKALAELDD